MTRFCKPSRLPLVATATAFLLGCVLVQSTTAQIKQSEQSASSVRYGEPQVSRYRVGAKVIAKRGAVLKIRAMVAVPFPCDEQQVEIVDEDISAQVDNVEYRDLQGGARQMLISIPQLAAGDEAHAIVTFEVRTHPILPPKETADLSLPKKPGRQLKRFLGKSPYIEVGHRKIRNAAEEAVKDLAKDATDWQRVEAIYDYVQAKVDYVEGPDKRALQVLKDRQGDCQAISALFVAMCRTSKIPARTVWVHGHVFPEFYLEDAAGEGHWFPCESSGRRAFGEMPLTRTILQKGDNFRVPERGRKTLRYASDYLTGLPTPGGGKPTVRYIREEL